MAWTFRSVGVVGTDGGGAAIVPAMPAGFQVGDLLLLWTGARTTSETLATPAGWKLLSLDSAATNIKLYGRFAQAGDTGPSIDWSSTSYAWAQIAAFSGGTYTDINTIVHSTRENAGTSANPSCGTMTVTQDNCLIIASGMKQKTATSDGTALNTRAGYTAIDSLCAAGTVACEGWQYLQQTTAANTSGANFTYTATQESALYRSTQIALRSVASSVGIGGPSQWVSFDLACRLKCLRQSSLNIGNTAQNIANLRTLALAQIALPSNPPWAKYSTAANMPKKILIYPRRVPGYVRPVAS